MITSTSNRDIRAVRRLRIADNRARLGLVLVEGPGAVGTVLDAGATIDRLLVTPRGERAHPELVRRAVTGGARKLVVSDDLLGLLCETASPPAMLAIVPKPRPAISADGPWCGVLVAGERDPRALGAMLLAAAACGASVVATTAGTADPWSPKVVRAAAAAQWRIPLEPRVDAEAWIEARASEGASAWILDDGLPSIDAVPASLLLVTGPDASKLGIRMRLDVQATTPTMPSSIGISHVLAAWKRHHRR